MAMAVAPGQTPQQLVRPVTPVPTPRPTAKPEPALAVTEGPFEIYRKIGSASTSDRRDAFAQLGWKEYLDFEDPDLIGNTGFYQVNLDDDPEMEAIIKVDISFPTQTWVLIFKHKDGEWRRIGDFRLWYLWDPDKAERMLELRNIVDLSHKEILIRQSAGGTDIQRCTDLTIYRVYDGLLYQTFETTEDFASHPMTRQGLTPDIEEVRHDISWRGADNGEAPYLFVHNSKRWVPDSAWGVVEVPFKSTGCDAWRWDPVEYLFIRDRAASVRLCPQPH